MSEHAHSTAAAEPTTAADRSALGVDLFDGLNAEQARAVAVVRGPVVILAGAGSGKTTTITRRIAHQITSGEFEPKNILAVTFTTKAAGELVERLGRLGAGGVPAKTFHAAALSQLTVLGRMQVDLLEAKTGLLWRIRNELPKEHREQHLGELAGEIQRAKSNRITPENYLDRLDGHLPPLPAELMQRVYADYENHKRGARKLDFEDLLETAIRMYENDDGALERFRARYKAITVDEYQDVNLLQQTLLDRWLGDRDDVCVVGDDFQAIFGFTGASPQYLLGMRDRFPHATVVKLETNYRSTPQVLAWANRLASNLGGIPKSLVAANADGPEPRLVEHPNEETEVDKTVARIKQLTADGTPPSEIAVLYRINARSTLFEHALHREKVPFQVADGGFIARPAWKSLRTKLGQAKTATDVKAVVAAALDDAGYVPTILESEVSPQEFTRQLDLTFINELADGFDDSGTVADFVVSVEREFATYSDGDTRDAVRLSTYHLAKGLEWEAVFLPRLNDGELPHWRSKAEAEIAEERRLFYVGITRAKRILELSTSGIRFPSRFVAEAAPPKPQQSPKPTESPKTKAQPATRRRGRGAPTLRSGLSPNSWHPFRKRGS
jgi:DNA helicase-2/ATP-dependent DNA helicase PcrA